MRVVVTGATGLLGKALISQLIINGDSVAVLTRNVQHAKKVLPLNVDVFHWNPSKCMPPMESLQHSDVVVHLAGESVQGRWTKTKKDRILQSRVLGTSNLVSALKSMENPPTKMVSASAVGYYGDRGDELLDESAVLGDGFLPEVCQVWEDAVGPARDKGIRVVHLRIGIVLTPLGGALKQMLLPFRLGVGGVLGTGSQYMSWVALDDLFYIIIYSLTNNSLIGQVNAVAPQAVTNRQFTKALGSVLNRPTILPAPAFALRLVLGEMAEALLVASTRVDPAVLREAGGFDFSYPDLESSLRHVLGRDRF